MGTFEYHARRLQCVSKVWIIFVRQVLEAFCRGFAVTKVQIVALLVHTIEQHIQAVVEAKAIVIT